MTDYAIRVEQMSKCYQIGAQRKPQSETLFAQFGSWLTEPYRRLRSGQQPDPADQEKARQHWALRDISFKLEEGESLGVIGHNGAGKSTLLKILSRITHPTAGVARVRGRMSSLLEVGTGFHPDLSGRDNVFMNAAILGLSRQQIRGRFDDIVQFSGVEEYIDTPIKHYSSGMKVRLAFAVAAHLDPDVLVIDEVLAVGDAEFQKKCITRMEGVGSAGRTLVFVSHNLPAVARLCKRAIIMDHGRIVFDGPTLEAIRLYEEKLGTARSAQIWKSTKDQPGDGVARLQSIELLSDGQPAAGPISVGSEIGVRYRYSVSSGGKLLIPSVHLFDAAGTAVMSALDTTEQWHDHVRPAGTYETIVTIPRHWLNEGTYSISVAVSAAKPYYSHIWVPEALQFRLFDPMQGDSALGRNGGSMAGYMRPILNWTTAAVSAKD